MHNISAYNYSSPSLESSFQWSPDWSLSEEHILLWGMFMQTSQKIVVVCLYSLYLQINICQSFLRITCTCMWRSLKFGSVDLICFSKLKTIHQNLPWYNFACVVIPYQSLNSLLRLFIAITTNNSTTIIFNSHISQLPSFIKLVLSVFTYRWHAGQLSTFPPDGLIFLSAPCWDSPRVLVRLSTTLPPTLSLINSTPTLWDLWWWVLWFVYTCTARA
jgi:hypothetical protein